MKKFSTLVIILTLFISTFYAPKAHALDLDDAFNVLSSFLAQYGQYIKIILEPLTEKIADEKLTKLTSETLNWANGGFDGANGFINNWGQFLEGTEHETLLSAFEQAESAVQQLSAGAGVNPQTNWELLQSGELKNSRNIATTIAMVGATQLNENPINTIISGGKETLTELLGSEQQKQAFVDDFNVGGWAGYISLSNQHNTASGRQGLIQGALQEESSEDVNNAVEDVQTPNKFTSKTECLEEDNATGDCLFTSTTTPGSAISGLVESGLNKEFDQTKLAEGLISSLIKALGDLTADLTTKGLSSLGGSSAQELEIDAAFQNQTQSDFNVLGIESDEGIDTGSGTTTYTGTSGTVGDGSGVLIGGPEDDTGGFGEGPQIIINFETDLETNITMAQEELDAYNEAKVVRNGALDNIRMLDYCLPAPDFRWNQRYKDFFQNIENTDGFQGFWGLGTNEETNDLQKEIGLEEGRSLVADPRANIPGALEIAGLVKSTVENNQTVAATGLQRTQALQLLISELNSIKLQIINSFNQEKEAISQSSDLSEFGGNWINLTPTLQTDVVPTMVLFREDWANLSTQQQIDLVELAINQSYYNPSTQGNTATTLVNQENSTAQNVVIHMGWDLWRDQADPELKTDLRYRYYAQRNRLSNQEFVAIANTRISQISSKVERITNVLNDCVIFKMYALGIDVQTIQTALGANGGLSPAIIEVYSEVANDVIHGIDGPSYGPYENMYVFEVDITLEDGQQETVRYPTRAFFLSPGEDTGDEVTPRTDSEIKTFLETQAQNQASNQDSLFKTELFTLGLNNSILGFNSEDEKDQYFSSLYSDSDDLYSEFTKTKRNVASIFMFDRFWMHIPISPPFPDADIETSTSFCRVPGLIDIKGLPAVNTCGYTRAGIAEPIEYQAAALGI